jgi:hypothetical protein
MSSAEDDYSEENKELSGPKVGYKSPPVNSRFKPGLSGNPAGKRKSGGAQKQVTRKMLNELILEEANRTLPVRQGNKNLQLPITNLVLRSLSTGAIKGSPSSARQFLKLVKSAEEIVTAPKSTPPGYINYDWSKLTDAELDTLTGILEKALPTS